MVQTLDGRKTMANAFTGEEETASGGNTVRLVGHSMGVGTFPLIASWLEQYGLGTEITAVSGSNIKQSNKFLTEESKLSHYKAVAIFTGVNDGWNRNAQKDMDKLVQNALEMSARAYLFNVVEYDDGKGSLDMCRKMNGHMKELADKSNGKIVLVDVNAVAKQTLGYDVKTLHGRYDNALYQKYANEFFRAWRSSELASAGQQKKAIQLH